MVFCASVVLMLVSEVSDQGFRCAYGKWTLEYLSVIASRVSDELSVVSEILPLFLGFCRWVLSCGCSQKADEGGGGSCD